MASSTLRRAARWAEVQLTDLDPRPVVESARTGAQHAASVAAGTPFANPFDRGGNPIQRMGAVSEYAVWLAGRQDVLTAIAEDLAGRDLACLRAGRPRVPPRRAARCGQPADSAV